MNNENYNSEYWLLREILISRYESKKYLMILKFFVGFIVFAVSLQFFVYSLILTIGIGIVEELGGSDGLLTFSSVLCDIGFFIAIVYGIYLMITSYIGYKDSDRNLTKVMMGYVSYTEMLVYKNKSFAGEDIKIYDTAVPKPEPVSHRYNKNIRKKKIKEKPYEKQNTGRKTIKKKKVKRDAEGNPIHINDRVSKNDEGDIHDEFEFV